MPARRFAISPLLLAAVAGAGSLLGACGGAGSGAAAGGTSTTTPPTTTPPTTSSSLRPTATSVATTAPGGLDFLTAWGATQDQWNANHTPDPGASSDYWPKLPDGLDTYTDLRLAAGRVVGYVLNLYPSVGVADAKSRLANDLPLDASVTSERPLPGCDQLVEQGPTVVAVSPGGLLAELESTNGGAYSASAIARIVVAPLPAGGTPPASC